MAKTIAIIGATGTNAAPWTDAFLAAGWRVRSVVRDPQCIPPRIGRTAAAIDLDDGRTYQPALAEVDPYRLARDIRGIGFRSADAIAMRLGITKETPKRLRAGVSA